MGTVLVLGITGLSIGALYFLLASGLAMIFGLMKVLSFAHGAYLAVAAYASWLVLRHSSLTQGPGTLRFLLAGAVAIGVGAALGLLTEVLLIRPLYGREHLDQLLVTAGLAYVLIGVLQGEWGANTWPLAAPSWLTGSVHVGGAFVTWDRFALILVAAVVFVGTELFLKYTRHGLIVRAGVENREMVQALGIDVRRSFTLIFTIGGAFAGIGGMLAGVYQGAISTDLGDNYLLYAFIVLVIGGLGSLRGALVAAVGVGLLQIYCNYYINVGLGDVVAVVLMAGILLLRPQGLFGAKGRLV